MIGERGDLHVEQCEVDGLPSSAHVPTLERSEHGNGRMQTGHDICQRHPDFHRPTLSLAGDTHQPAHALHEEVVARALRVRPRLAKSRDRTIDEAGIQLLETGVVESVLLQPTGLEVLQHDVGLPCQIPHQALAFRLAKIDGQ